MTAADRSLPRILEMYVEADDSWRADAACRGVDPDLFFPDRWSVQAEINAAKELCRGCPVRGACLDYALDTGQGSGIWGGYGERDRRRLKKVLRPYGRRRVS